MSEFTAPSVEELQAKFPSHHIDSFIAQGGMGAVYLASQTSLDRPVAIKILPKEFGLDEDYRISFETEAKAMAKLNHSNLVGIYDFGDVDGMLFIIMEYIPGRTLFDVAHGQQVDQVEAARLIADMCHGLGHAHSAGMLHRDIKPANVLIDDEGRPKIVDFGLARPLGEEQAEGVVFGTPGYTAPEVLTNPFGVDQRSDIFSMGVMLYEMLTGGLPGNPVLPASSVSRSDARFDKILSKAVHPDPAQRYGTAGEMAEDLEGLIKKLEGSGDPMNAVASVVARQPAINLGGSSLAGARPVVAGTASVGSRPVVVSSKSGGSAGLIIGVIAALAVGVIVLANMGGDDKPSEPTAAELRVKELEDAEKFRKKEEKRIAEEARKKQEAKALEEKKLKEIEEREAKVREEEERERAIAREALMEKKRLEREKRERLEREQEIAREKKAGEDEVEKPVYDHVSFILENRMRAAARAERTLEKHGEAFETALDLEEKAVKKVIGSKKRFGLAHDKVEEYFDKWREGGVRPKQLPRLRPNVKEALDESIENLKKVSGTLSNELSEYQEKYTKALRSKLSELEKDNVTDSVNAIKAELDALAKEGYFVKIVKLKNPSPEEEEEGEEDKKGRKGKKGKKGKDEED